MRHKASFLAALARQHPRHADALEMTKLFHKINFAQMLGVGQAELLRYDAKEGIETAHHITPYFCRTDAVGEYLSAGVITALFDEVSTAACILQDKTHRPGVSVALDVEVLANVGPGATLRLKTWADKVGKTLAFLRLDLRDEDSGRLVAVGKHCKYLPMGLPLWDAAFAPGLYPLVRSSLFNMTKKQIAQGEQVEHTGSLLDYFPLDGLALASPRLGAPSPSPSPEPTTATLRIQPRHCNGMFKMHGGALAVAAEDLAVRDAVARQGAVGRTAATQPPPPRVEVMSIHYLQANSNVIDLAAWVNDEAAAAVASSQVEVRRKGRLCNYVNIKWQ